VDFIRQHQAAPATSEAGPLSWRLALRPVLSFGFLLAAGVLLANAAAAYWNIRTVAATNRWVVHTHQVLTQVQETLSLLKDAETGQRGFLITGERPYLEPYESAVRQVHGRFQRLRELTSDNPNQKARTDELKGLIAQRLEELEQTIRLRREEGFEATRKVVVADRGKRLMDRVRRLMSEMEVEEQGLLERRTAESDARVSRALATVVVVSCLVLVSFFARRLVTDPARARLPSASAAGGGSNGRAARSGGLSAAGPGVEGRR